MFKVLIDLCHNNQIKYFPEDIFDSSEFLFCFTNATDDLSINYNLDDYDLIILGNPKPRNFSEQLFRPEELSVLKKYVSQGGGLLVTSGSRGDYNCKGNLGSLRVLVKLTGIKQFHYSILFNLNKNDYFGKKTSLLIKDFTDHQIFNNFSKKDSLVFRNSTFFSLDPEINSNSLLYSPKNTMMHSFLTKKKEVINKVPLVIANEYHLGKVITISSSEIFSKNPKYGIRAKSNSKLVKGVLSWLLNKEIH